MVIANRTGNVSSATLLLKFQMLLLRLFMINFLHKGFSYKVSDGWQELNVRIRGSN